MEHKVFLTDEENDMLLGKAGTMKQKAMEVIVRYADVLGAKKLCKITKAHLFCGAHPFMLSFPSSDPDEVISKMLFCSDEKVALDRYECPYCQSDAAPMDSEKWRSMGVAEPEAKRNEQFLHRFLDSGVHLASSCIPYMLGFVPLMGEHYVSTESHAVVLMNSLWGACGNADGVEIAFSAAACGRIPLWGTHIAENRKGTHIFRVLCNVASTHDWDLLGYTVGRKLPTHSVPVLVGAPRPNIVDLKSFFASLATTAGPEICHIVGITPEAPTLDSAMGGNKPVRDVTVTEEDLEESRRMLSDAGEGSVQYVSVGCPHYSIDQVERAARYLRGKKIAEGVTLQVWTAPQIRYLADRCGYSKVIEDAGGVVLTGSCPMVSEKLPKNAAGLAFDSAKQAHYLRPVDLMQGKKIYYGSMEQCLEAALSGMWKE